jgi:uncharacterized protein YlzI (FlbEa/FlbD family)
VLSECLPELAERSIMRRWPTRSASWNSLEDGNPVSINVAQIVSFETSDEQTLTTLTNGRCLTVRDTLDAVSEVVGSDLPPAADSC